ncbi:glycosyltransferase family 2 protein [Aliiroseovarius sp. Z3]|uniref:glycosyltransferase family 2 protein n=1 Tax=Aliiroseovarius sp. Z3 TaxID=2811402 RepID=UPI0023B2D3CA|nr:glycosyltransferase family 2 protein [Aliiroseovarius sp. Z3]MDE9451483.1 glycosyltransferase family 2 protein [Aliiroseovarius sp. Z3]
MKSAPHIAILLATYNGGQNLKEQLASIANQDHDSWSLIVSDDGSQDDTRKVLTEFATEGHPVTILDGPQQGAAANFMSLLRRFSDHAPDGAWVAFCDQDDVWLADKLSRSIRALEGFDGDVPALYCSRTWITNDALEGRRLSVPRPRPLGFRNALVQNVASGNTILLNAAGTELVSMAARETSEVVVHDWWTYQILAGVGGHLVHDDEPTLLYRQHNGNEIGANDNTKAKLARIGMLLSGHFAEWNRLNARALAASAHLFVPENQLLLEDFRRVLNMRRRKSWRILKRMKLYRQTRASTAALWFALMLRRL